MEGSVSGHTDARTAGYTNSAEVLASVRQYYGEVLQSANDLKTTACTACGAPPPHVRAALAKVPQPVLEKFYGCGNPVPAGIQGCTVLDLGCGSGRDCYVASLFAGKTGHVIGIDMTAEQLATARESQATFAAANPDAAKLDFKEGMIEDIAGAGVANGTVDLIVSNCVVNLSPNKFLVLNGAYNALKVGGELHFSDLYCDRRLSDEVRRHKLLLGEGLSGALYTTDLLHMCRRIGFDVRELSRSPIAVHDKELADLLGNARFDSITYRCFKLDPATKDDECEEYGQFATYMGTLPYAKHGYTLDSHHFFETGRAYSVCGNTAMMLAETWLGPHFRIVGDKNVHYGSYGACGSAARSGGCGQAGECC